MTYVSRTADLPEFNQQELNNLAPNDALNWFKDRLNRIWSKDYRHTLRATLLEQEMQSGTVPSELKPPPLRISLPPVGTTSIPPEKNKLIHIPTEEPSPEVKSRVAALIAEGY